MRIVFSWRRFPRQYRRVSERQSNTANPTWFANRKAIGKAHSKRYKVFLCALDPNVHLIPVDSRLQGPLLQVLFVHTWSKRDLEFPLVTVAIRGFQLQHMFRVGSRLREEVAGLIGFQIWLPSVVAGIAEVTVTRRQTIGSLICDKNECVCVF